jgi:hypothetical protein
MVMAGLQIADAHDQPRRGSPSILRTSAASCKAVPYHEPSTSDMLDKVIAWNGASKGVRNKAA